MKGPSTLCCATVEQPTKKVAFSEAEPEVWNYVVSSNTKMRRYDYERKRRSNKSVDVSKISSAKSNRAAREARKHAKIWAKRIGADQGGPRSVSMPCVPRRTWIVDSGSCFDLVSAKTLSKYEKDNITLAEKPFLMTTANGKVEVSHEAVVPIEITGSETSACVMENAPCVLSLGKRCMLEGCSFEWGAGQNPVLVTPDGTRHELEVQNLVPVLPVVADETAGGSHAEESKVLPSTTKPSSSVEGSRNRCSRKGEKGDRCT